MSGTVVDVVCDVLLVATGRKPNVEGIGLEAAGIKYSSTDGVEVRTKCTIFVCECKHAHSTFIFMTKTAFILKLRDHQHHQHQQQQTHSLNDQQTKKTTSRSMT